MNYLLTLFLLSALAPLKAASLDIGCSFSSTLARDSLDFTSDNIHYLHSLMPPLENYRLQMHTFEINLSKIDIFLLEAKPWLLYNERIEIEGDFKYGFVCGGKARITADTDLETRFLYWAHSLPATLSVTSDLPKREGRYLSLGGKLACHFYPFTKVRLSPFIGVYYRQYKLPLPSFPPTLGLNIDDLAHEYFKKNQLTIPWPAPSLGLQLSYTVAPTAKVALELNYRLSKLLSPYLHRYELPSRTSGYGAKVGADFQINSQMKINLEGSYESDKAQVYFQTTRLTALRSSTQVLFELILLF